MESVGTQIRDARLQAGLSLQQVSANTCIPVKNLQAIEEDNFHQISSAFFYKSFVRQFCVQVGLAVESLKEPIAIAVASFPDPLIPGQDEAVIRNSMIRPARRSRKLRWLYPALSLALVLVACSGFYAYYQRLRIGLPYSLIEKTTIAPHAANPAPGIAQPKAAVPAESDGRFHVELSAVERTWLSIRADGKQIYSGTLEVAQTKVLEGREEGQLRTGNAGGVNIVFNGKPIGLAGPHGSVRTVVFTRDNYEVLPVSVHTVLNPEPLPKLFPMMSVGELLLPPPVR